VLSVRSLFTEYPGERGSVVKAAQNVTFDVPEGKLFTLLGPSGCADEHAVETRPDVRRRPDGSYLVDGTVPVRELNRELDWNLPEEDATTIAGLVIAQSGTIPETGQRFAFFGYTFEIMRRQRNQITAIRIVPPVRASQPQPA
jgi:Mg2+/Co2+ transporter CorB